MYHILCTFRYGVFGSSYIYLSLFLVWLLAGSEMSPSLVVFVPEFFVCSSLVVVMKTRHATGQIQMLSKPTTQGSVPMSKIPSKKTARQHPVDGLQNSNDNPPPSVDGPAAAEPRASDAAVPDELDAHIVALA